MTCRKCGAEIVMALLLTTMRNTPMEKTTTGTHKVVARPSKFGGLETVAEVAVGGGWQPHLKVCSGRKKRRA